METEKEMSLDEIEHELNRLRQLQSHKLDYIRDCRFSCVNIKNNSKNETHNRFRGSGFILYWDTFTPLREKLKKTFEHQIQDDKFTDFQFLVITNYHVVEVGTLLGV